MESTPETAVVTSYALPSAWRYELKATIGALLKYTLLIFIMLVVLFPIYWMVNTSFKNRLELTTYPPTLFPQDLTGFNYQDAFTNSGIPRYVLNSVIVVTVSTFISL